MPARADDIRTCGLQRPAHATYSHRPGDNAPKRTRNESENERDETAADAHEESRPDDNTHGRIRSVQRTECFAACQVREQLAGIGRSLTALFHSKRDDRIDAGGAAGGEPDG